MGKRFLRSIVADQVNQAAAGDIQPLDLPVNPLSFLILTLWIERPDEDAISAHRLISDCFLAVSDLSIRHRGENIIQGSLADLCMAAALLTGYTPWGANVAGLGQRQSMNFLIPFGRVPYWHEEAFPATSRGNLRLYMTFADVSPGTGTAVDYAVEAVELIEDTPTKFLKFTTMTRTPPATGRQRAPLPLGNDLVGILLCDGLTEITATEAFCWGKVKIMKDNTEQYYAESNAESLRFDVGNRIWSPAVRFGHMHASDGTAVPTGDELLDINRAPLQYAYLDFDPLKDGSYLLDTRGAGSLDIDMNVDSIAGAPTARYLPIELISVGGK